MNIKQLIWVLGALLYCALTVKAIGSELGLEYDPSRFNNRSRIINPDASVYGVPFGTSSKEMVVAFGQPSGIIMINDFKKALMYGSSHLFIFKRDKFRELLISDHIFPWDFTSQMDAHPFFDGKRWELKQGITAEMDFKSVSKKIGQPNAKPNYSLKFEGERSSNELKFSHWTGATGDTGYRVIGLRVIHYGN